MPLTNPGVVRISGSDSTFRGTVRITGGANITAGTDASGILLSVGNYLTTARASNDAIGLNTALTGNGVAWTVNSSGLSLNVPAFLTTAMASNRGSDFVQATAAFAGTNASGTIASNGISVSVAAGGTTNQTGPNIAAGTQTGTSGTIVFSNSNNITFGMSNSSVVTASFNPINMSYVPIGPQFLFNTVTTSFVQSTSYMVPFMVPGPLSAGSVRLFEAGSLAASSTQAIVNGSTLSAGATTSHNFVFYSRGTGASSMSLQYVTSTQVVDRVSVQLQNAAGANSSQISYTYRFSIGNTSFTKDYSSSANSFNYHTSGVTDLTGTKQVDYPAGISLSGGQWFLGYGRSTSSATQNAAVSVMTRMFISYDSQFAVSQATLGALGTLGAATNSSVMLATAGLGSFTTSGAAGTVASVGFAVISSGTSNQIPYMQLIRIA